MTRTNAKNWSRENLIWAAGFLEGEGCFGVHKKPRKNKPDQSYYYINIQAAQNQRSKDCLEKLQYILGGTINGPYKTKTTKTKQDEMVMWTLSSQHLVYATCVALFPFMCSRRQAKIIELITAFSQNTRRRKF